MTETGPAPAVLEETFSLPSSDDTSQVHGRLWEPASASPRGIVQLVHGMSEHIARYDPLARRLAEAGFAVIGHDHVGHGKTSPRERHGMIPARDGADILVSDVHRVRDLANERFPGLPHVIFGHSMGSFVTRCEIGRAGEGLAGAVICGTGQIPGALTGTGRIAARAIAAVGGEDRHSALLQKLALGNSNARIDHPRTEVDWLSANEANVDAYLADTDCGAQFSAGGFATLFSVAHEACARSTFESIPNDLPLLFIAGSDDPIGSYGDGVRTAADRARRSGAADVSCTIYPGMRHEILNEVEGERVMDDVLSWLEARIA
ncbi:MAG: alpha/beta hydrolase [Coriobacteriaceae bacterium]|nr:alpha/beta hydrolase [Coriobacteriaceae bacterium]